MITNMATLTLPDGKANPEIHTFSPATRRGDVARWLDRDHNQGIALGFASLEFSAREPVRSGGVSRSKIAIAIPKLDTSTTVPTEVGVGRFVGEFIYPPSYTAEDRENLRAMAYASLGKDKLGENVTNLVTPY